MNKKFIALALTLSLGLTACRLHKDEPQPKPDTNQPQPEQPKEPEKPAQPEAKIVIEGGVLKSYPEAKVAEDGVVTLEATVTEIGEGAFAGNTKIKTLVAPGLKKIGARAFAGATAFHLLDLSSYKPEGQSVYPETAMLSLVRLPTRSLRSQLIPAISLGSNTSLSIPSVLLMACSLISPKELS